MELRELLEIGPGLTALIGGGGKTTLMYHLAAELRQQGTVLVCTTTKIWPPAHLRVCTEEGTLREELRRRGIACAGMPAEQGKLTNLVGVHAKETRQLPGRKVGARNRSIDDRMQGGDLGLLLF